MTDIVSRLRQSYHLDTVQPDHILRVAVDEIERLRAECERLRAAPPQPAVVTDEMCSAAIDAEEAFYRQPVTGDISLRQEAMRAALVAAMGVRK